MSFLELILIVFSLHCRNSVIPSANKYMNSEFSNDFSSQLNFPYYKKNVPTKDFKSFLINELEGEFYFFLLVEILRLQPERRS